MSWPCAISSASVGTAKSGVPKKARRMAASARVFQTLGLLQFAQRDRALELGEVVDEKNAFEMIHLVLQAGREQPVRFYLLTSAFAVEEFDADACRTLDLVPDFRNRETTFLERRQFLRGPQD